MHLMNERHSNNAWRKWHPVLSNEMPTNAGNEAEASALANKINAAGGRAITVQADVSKPAEVVRMFDVTEKQFGGVDVLVNNAGIMTLSTIAAADDAMFDRIIAVNLKGTFNGLREAAKRLRGGGS